jgi:hypothetical protein
MERETGIEPATNSLEGCDSTTELLPPTRSLPHRLALRRASPLRVSLPSLTRCFSGQARFVPSKTFATRSTSLRQPALRKSGPPSRFALRWTTFTRVCTLACQPKLAERAKVGGEGRTRTFEAARATDLQSAAFDRFATSPNCLYVLKSERSAYPRDRRSFSSLELAKGFEPPTC